MPKQEEVAKGHTGRRAFEHVHETWAIYLPNIYSFAVKREEDAYEIRFRCRGPGDWIGIAKRTGSDGQAEVLFGTAFDFVSCVLAVNAAMSGDRWRDDRPWDGGKD